MGASHYVANAAKRQFFRPGAFDNDRSRYLLRGLASHVLAQLIGGRMPDPGGLGCWAGDPLYIADDGVEPVWAGRLMPEVKNCVSDYEMLTTAYADVTYPVIAGLGYRDDVAIEFVERANRSDSSFLELTTILQHYDAPALRTRYLTLFGRDWHRRFDQIRARNGWWQPLPTLWGRPDRL
jgi:hypothetical protein